MRYCSMLWLGDCFTKNSLWNADTVCSCISDAWEDSDGDGAFNFWELIIGKNSARLHDILDVFLSVYVDPLILSCPLHKNRYSMWSLCKHRSILYCDQLFALFTVIEFYVKIR